MSFLIGPAVGAAGSIIGGILGSSADKSAAQQVAAGMGEWEGLAGVFLFHPGPGDNPEPAIELGSTDSTHLLAALPGKQDHDQQPAGSVGESISPQFGDQPA